MVQAAAELGPLHQALALSFHQNQPPTVKEGLNEGMLSEKLKCDVFMRCQRENVQYEQGLITYISPSNFGSLRRSQICFPMRQVRNWDLIATTI